MAVLPASANRPAERRSLTPDECQALLQAAHGDRLEALWVLALTTGARRGELLRLAWDAVDLDAGTVRVQQALRRADHRWRVGPTKTAGSVRTLRLGPTASAALKRHRTAQQKERLASDKWRESGLVFTALGPAVETTWRTWRAWWSWRRTLAGRGHVAGRLRARGRSAVAVCLGLVARPDSARRRGLVGGAAAAGCPAALRRAERVEAGERASRSFALVGFLGWRCQRWVAGSDP